MPKPTTDLKVDTEVKADPALEKRTRRTFTADYKLRMVQQADACAHGELGALLRREKLYHNQITQWRRELNEGGIESLSKSAPGPKPRFSPEERHIAQLQKRIQRLEYQLELKDACLDLQKKALSMLDHQQNGPDE
jgi:transposase-like protein